MKFNTPTHQRICEFIERYNPQYIIIDCDGTLYPNIFEARSVFYESLYNFFSKKFNYSRKNTDIFLREQKEKYGTVSEIAACLLSGIDEVEFNTEVIESMDLEDLDIGTSSPWCILLEYNIPIIIFTNNSSFFASLIARKVGIIHNVEHIFGESELHFVRKPSKEVFKVVTNFLPKDSRILFFDDDELCVKMGNNFGWKSVQVVYSKKHLTDVKGEQVLIIN